MMLAMRSSLLLFALVSTEALAQYDNGGVWTGYVGGWKPNTQNVNTIQVRQQRRQNVVVVPYAVPVAAPAPQPDAAALQAEQRRAWDAEQARIAQQTQLENERRLAADREAMLQRQLETERQLAQEREALNAQRMKLELEERARAQAALVAAAPAPVEPPKPAAPQTPGNDIYRWVDADGVVHYSTNVPAAMKASATKVGGSR